MSFICIRIKNHLQISGFTLRLVLKQKLKATEMAYYKGTYAKTCLSDVRQKEVKPSPLFIWQWPLINLCLFSSG